jgi:hypothetical protein
LAGRGNPNPKGSKPDKLMRDALMVALNREAVDAEGKPTKKLALLASALVDKAVGGDVSAANAVMDRVDGKPHQTTDVTVLRQRAEELSDDVLAGIAASGSGEGVTETPGDSTQLH